MLKKLIFPILFILIVCILVVPGCKKTIDIVNEEVAAKTTADAETLPNETNIKEMTTNTTSDSENSAGISVNIIPAYKNSRYKEIYLAGGCFWGVQTYIDRINGVEYTNVGYANGESNNTDYYSLKKTGHTETVYAVYDPEKITLEELLGYYYGIIDPTSLNKQGNDQGTQYRTGIYYVDEEDKKIIEEVTREEQAKYREKIVTEIQPLANYVLAEDYHQNYLDINPGGYCHIDLSKIPREKPKVNPGDYPKPTIEEIKKKLTDLQFSITQKNDTEYAFKNEYWDNKETGLYVDIVTGEPLFLSSGKFDSGTGWPSFTRPIQWDVLTYNSDESGSTKRIEVRSRSGDSHLGHLFDDGPVAEGALRYCINSGALDFIELDKMEEQGYGKFIVLFE